MNNVITLILAGGVGSRLAPLTHERAKPAVPFGGKYRIIDFTLSNCLHSGLRKILVLTQYKSHSLQKHLRDGWSIFNPSINEFITPVPPQMRTGDSWYEGTADAVYQNLFLLERSECDITLILSGDHIYRMDYAAMIDFHRQSQADATVASMQVARNEASAFGVLDIAEDYRISHFIEKPMDPPALPNDPNSTMVSMGVYVFSTKALCEILRSDHSDGASSHDFGKNILPTLLENSRVFAYPFGSDRGRVTQDRYWRDVGTIDAYFDANMDLLRKQPPLNLYQPDWPIFTFPKQAPPAKTVAGSQGHSHIINSSMSGGVIVVGAHVEHSILAANVVINDDANVKNSILLESVNVAAGARIQNAIIDKYARIPEGMEIGYNLDQDRQRFTVSENGVVVVPRAWHE